MAMDTEGVEIKTTKKSGRALDPPEYCNQWMAILSH